MSEDVGYLGPDDSTFGYDAAEQYFRGQADIKLVPFKTHAEICNAVGKRKIQRGVVAIENTAAGIVTETVFAMENAFSSRSVHAIAEIELAINQLLLRKINDGSLPKKLLSHIAAQQQCKHFIASLLKQGVIIEARNSTGEAAKEASENPEFAAIASENAEKKYGLIRVQAEPVADSKTNFTRFWVLGTEVAERKGDGKYKTCLLVNLEQAKSGVLSKTLECFSRRGVNLFIVFPIPIPGRKWEYTFLLEYGGHFDDEAVQEAYNELTQEGLCVGSPLVLGSYPSVTTTK